MSSDFSKVDEARLPSESVEAAPLVRCRNVIKHFRRGKRGFLWGKPDSKGLFRALDCLSMDVRRGEIVGLVGESGSGKTTLGKAILKLHSIESGTIELEGRDLGHMKESEMRPLRRYYQMIFQNPHASLNPGMRVMDSLLETAALHLGLRGKEGMERAMEMLDRVRLTHRSQAWPSELSGGEKRRVGLARVFMLNPKLIVADEPTAGLDASLKAGIVRLMIEMKEEQMAYLLISHDLHLVRFIADRVLVMFRGRIVESIHRGFFSDNAPHHPYTQRLLASHSWESPGHSNGEREKTPENLSLPPSGGCCYYAHCIRAHRLGKKAEICRETSPPFLFVEGGTVKCHFAKGEE